LGNFLAKARKKARRKARKKAKKYLRYMTVATVQTSKLINRA
tara:strand:+ start:2034 stop:2159 length:126 start_codon:yes stop_codon:yes gene_type:complete